MVLLVFWYKKYSIAAILFVASQIMDIYCDPVEVAPSFDQNEVGNQHVNNIENTRGDDFLRFLDNLFSLGPKNATSATNNNLDSRTLTTLPIESHIQPKSITRLSNPKGSENAPAIFDKNYKLYNDTEWNMRLANALDALDYIANLSRSSVDERIPLGPPTLQEQIPATNSNRKEASEEIETGRNSAPKLVANMDSWGNMFKTISAERIPTSDVADGNLNKDGPYNNTEWNAWLTKVIDALDSMANASRSSRIKSGLLGSPEEEQTLLPNKNDAVGQESSDLKDASEKTQSGERTIQPRMYIDSRDQQIPVDEKANQHENEDQIAEPLSTSAYQTEPLPDPVELTVVRNNKNDHESLLSGVVPPRDIPFYTGDSSLVEIQRNFASGPSKLIEHQNPGIQLMDSIFCRAKCVEECLTIKGGGFFECQTTCKTSQLETLCALNDTPCLAACSINAINHDLLPPNITRLKYYSKETMIDAETMEVFWDPVPGAALYLVSVVADTDSIRAGADYLMQDMTNMPWYSFKKPDLCFQYYISVSAILRNGITPFSQPVFQPSAVRSLNDLKVEKNDIAFTKVTMDQFREVRFVDVILDVFSHVFFDLGKVQLTSYLLASQCADPAGLTGRPLMDKQDVSTKIAITNVQFLHTQQKVVVRLPLDVIALNCLFEYRIAFMKTRCGNVISYVSNIGTTFDSTVGTDFRLNCDTAPYPGCYVNQPAANVPPLNSVSSDVSGSEQNLQPADNSIICNVENFKVDFLGDGTDGMYNVTVSWDPDKDDKPKTYLLRHGSVRRQLIQELSSASNPDFDPVPVLALSAEPSDQSRLAVKLDRPLIANDLHVFQLCVVDVGAPVDLVDWDQAPKRLIDLAAMRFPQNTDPQQSSSQQPEHGLEAELLADPSNHMNIDAMEQQQQGSLSDNQTKSQNTADALDLSSSFSNQKPMLARDPPERFNIWNWFRNTQASTQVPRLCRPTDEEYINLGWNMNEREILRFVFAFVFVITVISVSVFSWYVLVKCCAKKGLFTTKNPVIFVHQMDSPKKQVEFVGIENPLAQQAK